jgi:predicted membrane metal-binding protein
MAHLAQLSDYQQLPACLARDFSGAILSLQLGDEADLPAEVLEALRVIIDELNLQPAR